MSQNQSRKVYSLQSDGTIAVYAVPFQWDRALSHGSRRTLLSTHAYDLVITADFNGTDYLTDPEGNPMLFSVTFKESFSAGLKYPCRTQAEAEALHAGILLHLLEKKHKVKPIRPEDLNKPDGLRRVLKR